MHETWTGPGALYAPGKAVSYRPSLHPRPPPAASQRRDPCHPGAWPQTGTSL